MWSRTRLFISLISLLCLSVHPFVTWAIDESRKKGEENLIERTMLNTSAQIAEKLDNVADKIDVKLAGGKRYTKKPNPSRIKIGQSVTWTEGGEVRPSNDFSLDLRLPNVEKRWQARFSNYDESKEGRDLRQRAVRTRPRERDYGAGLFFLRKLGVVKASFQPRLELRDPLEVSHVLRFESLAQKDPFRLKPRLEFFADPKIGTGQFFSIVFDTELSKYWELSFQNEQEYRDKGNIFSTQHGTSLHYAIGNRNGIGTAVVFGSNSRPVYHLETITASIGYGHILYEDYMNFGISPFIQFPKGEHFKGESGISSTLELIF